MILTGNKYTGEGQVLTISKDVLAVMKEQKKFASLHDLNFIK